MVHRYFRERLVAALAHGLHEMRKILHKIEKNGDGILVGAAPVAARGDAGKAPEHPAQMLLMGEAATQRDLREAAGLV